MCAKKSNNQPKKNYRPVLILSVILVLILVAVLVLKGANTARWNEPEASETAAETLTETTQPDIPALFELGKGIKVTEIIPYTGAFMEDRTDEVLTDILAIQVVNTGDTFIQTMDITLFAGEAQAQFTLSTLFPGETVIVLEKNRMSYSTAPEFDRAQVSTDAYFEAHPGLCEDKLTVQCLDGILNVTNISGEDITGDILIYYKNYVGGSYYGGITYRLRIEGGLKAGEIRQGSAAHFNPDNSKVVFVTCN